MNCYSAISLQQHSAGRHVAALGHIIMRSNKYQWYCLSFVPIEDRTHEHTNHYTTDAVNFKRGCCNCSESVVFYSLEVPLRKCYVGLIPRKKTKQQLEGIWTYETVSPAKEWKINKSKIWNVMFVSYVLTPVFAVLFAIILLAKCKSRNSLKIWAFQPFDFERTGRRFIPETRRAR